MGLCKCAESRGFKEIGFWDHCPLEGGGHTQFKVNRCVACGGVSGFPDTNMEIALNEGTILTKYKLAKIIDGG